MSDLHHRRQEDKARRREQILDAAAAVAMQYGLAAFSMDQVARKARLSRALLYVYFTDKQDLLMGLAERGQQMLYDRFATIAVRRLNGLKKITAMGRAYVEFAEASPLYFEALSHFVAHEADTEDRRQNMMRCLEGGNRIHQQIEQTLSAGMKDGSLRHIEHPGLVSMTLWAFMHGIIQVTTTKKQVLAFRGMKAEQLVNQALNLCTQALIKERK